MYEQHDYSHLDYNESDLEVFGMISKSLGILLMGAFLGTWSPAQAAQNPGFEPEGLVLAHLRFGPNHPTSEKNRVYRSLAEAIAELPRVDGVAWVQSIPFGPHLRLLFEVPDRSSQEFLEGTSSFLFSFLPLPATSKPWG